MTWPEVFLASVLLVAVFTLFGWLRWVDHLDERDYCDPSDPQTHCGRTDCTDHGCQESG